MSKTTQLSQVGAFTGQTLTAIQAAINSFAAGLFTPGNVYFLDPANGSDASGDGSLNTPFATLAQAYAQCVAGNNDCVVLIANGATSATARVNAAFTWAKAETHLLGICAPVLYSQRARIAPASTTTAFTPYFTVSASGCVFQNIQWFMGFTTGTATAIGMLVSGSRNYFKNCQIAGMADAASAQSAGSRSLKITTGGENVFDDCVIGLDTVTRTAANASIEFAGATTRNRFRRCTLPFMGSSATILGILGTGAECCDRDQTFEDCLFINQIKSTSTQMTVLGSFTSASPGGMVIFRHCAMVGATKFGDTNFLANSFIDMPATSAAGGGLMLAPT